MLIQLRTGQTGLNAFLFQRRVPHIVSPLCQCGTGTETVAHIILRCPIWREPRQNLPPRIFSTSDLVRALGDPDLAPDLARWFIRLGQLAQFHRATQIKATTYT